MAEPLTGDLKIGKVKISKKAVVIGGAVAVGIIGYAYYQRSIAGSSGGGDDSEEELIDPYTGLPLSDEFQFPAYQAMTISDPTGTPFGTGLGGQVVTQVDTNAGWTQAAMAYLSQNGSYEPSALLDALGKALAGNAVTTQEAAMFNAARAVMGEPPQPWGPNGTRVLVHTNSNPNNPPPTTSTPGASLPAPKNLRAVNITTSTIRLDWDPVPGAIGYSFYSIEDPPADKNRPGARLNTTTVYSIYTRSGLRRKTRYRFQVRAVGTDHAKGAAATAYAKTK